MPSSSSRQDVLQISSTNGPGTARCRREMVACVRNAGIAGALFIASFSALAATQVYKWKDKNGGIVYSQKAPTDPAVRDLQTLEIESLPVEQQRAANKMMSDLRRQSEVRTGTARSQNEAAEKRVETALDLLASAESALDTGSTPTSDDRIGLADGGTRLTPAYFERVDRLKANVAKARQNLDEAYAARYAK
ncbi:hypothetical protein BH11PSE11_BH11PSE11_03180 [soil metagenome]